MASEILSKSLLSVLQGNGEFTKKLYKSFAKTPGNVLFSPISLHAILSLVSQGSAGETREAFAKALHIQDVKIAAEGHQNILTTLNSVKDVTLRMANKLFLQEGYKLLDTFNTIAVNQFLSDVQLLNFAQSQDSAISINSWVENTTNGKIKNLISSEDLNEDTSLVLVNAVYFKGKWKEPFKPGSTRMEKFYINQTNITFVDMMHINGNFNFKCDDKLDAKLLELPYINDAFSLLIILPNDRNGITELEENLVKTDLTELSQNMRYVEVEVDLPKFKFEHTMDLKQPLTEFGLGNIFIPGVPNFSGMIECEKTSYVSKVVQKAFIEVNEGGTEAAAASSCEMMLVRLCYSRLPPEKFVADHPFIILLQVKQANIANILFTGRVFEPMY